MSYNISNVKVRFVEMTITPELMEKIVAKLYRGLEISPNMKKWSLNETGEGLSMEGIIENENYVVTKIDCFGEGSGQDWEIVEQLFRETRANFEAIVTWENGDNIEEVIVKDGEIGGSTIT